MSKKSGPDLKGTFVVVVAFMLAKSLLASRQAKEAVERTLGPRVRNGLYRPFYIAFSSIGGLLVLLRVYRGPDRVLYEIRGPARWLLRAGQLALVVITFDICRAIGPGFFGAPQLKAFLTGGQPQTEPEAQGPPPIAGGQAMSTGSLFKFSRHPNNWFPISVFFLAPRMTRKKAMFCALAAVHVLLGSVHEEYRLRAAYDGAYDRYKQTAPFFVGPSRHRP